MARKTEKIKPIRGERLKILLEREKTSQKILAEKIYVTPQTISKIINGKSNLTESTADSIIKEFPLYRKEWLMGFDDMMTGADFFDSLIAQHRVDYDAKMECIRLLAKIRDFNVELYYKTSGIGGEEQHIYQIRKGKKVCYLSYDDLVENLEVYCDLFEMKINRELEKGQNNDGDNT